MNIKIVFNWYLSLRLMAFFAQSVLILIAIFYLEIDLPIYQLILVTSLIPITNLIFYFDKKLKDLNYKTASLLITDSLLLTAFLFYSGGYSNPFSTFYILQIILAGILLGSRFAWLIAAFSTISYAFLFYFYYPVHELEHHGHHGVSLHLTGMFVSFVLLALSVCYFVVKILQQVEKAKLDLAQSKQKEKDILHLASLNTLLASVAHELNTPLNTIYLIANDLDSETPDQDLHLITEQIKSCKKIIDDLRLKSGVLQAENFEEISLGELIEEITVIFSKKIIVDQDFDPASRLTLPTQATIKILQGLIANAIDSDSQTPVQFSCNLEKGILKIQILDKGKGMNEEQLRKLGQPFFTTKSGQGLGLGVYLAKSLIALLGGKIKFESKQDKGTNVKIEIPIYE